MKGPAALEGMRVRDASSRHADVIHVKFYRNRDTLKARFNTSDIIQNLLKFKVSADR